MVTVGYRRLFILWWCSWLLVAYPWECLGLSAPNHKPSGGAVGTNRIGRDESSSSLPHPTGFYIHIPYCRRRCRYCNFSIVPIGLVSDEKSSSFAVIHEQYQADLFAELDVLLQQEQGRTIVLSSIYFGGGTPSLAPVGMIQGILQRILQSSSPFTLADNAEITMEMDPGTFSLEQLQSLKDLGVNRISLGVQSFDDSILEAMGRVHRRSDAMEAIQMIRQVFGEDANYSMDLISGVPGLTTAKWIETLDTATTTFGPPSHLSIYDLQVEEGTVFSTWYNNGDDASSKKASRIAKIPNLPNEESVAFMYKFSAGYLRRKGYEHYEVSSYAYRGTKDTDVTNKQVVSTRRSRHNQIYWATLSHWYAVGLGATSCVQGRLEARPKTMSDYHDWVMAKQREQTIETTVVGKSTAKDEQEGDARTEDDLLTDIIMKRLRTSDGLDLDFIEQRFGAEIVETILKGATLGLELNMAELILPDGDDLSARGETTAGMPLRSVLRLTDPEGFLYSNYIISSIFAELGYE